MSSLRLALKQSLEEAVPVPTKDEIRAAKQKSKRDRKRKRELLKEKREQEIVHEANRKPISNSLELIRKIQSVSSVPVGGDSNNRGKGLNQSGNSSSSSESDSDDGSSNSSDNSSSSDDKSGQNSSSSSSGSSSGSGSSSSSSDSSSDSDDDSNSDDERHPTEDMEGVFDSERSSDEDGNGKMKRLKLSHRSSTNHFGRSDDSDQSSDKIALPHPSQSHKLLKKVQKHSAASLISKALSHSPTNTQPQSSRNDPSKILSTSLSSSHISVKRSLPSSTLSTSSSKKEKRSISSTSVKTKRKERKGKPKAVPAPIQQVLAWVMGISQEKQRRKILSGMRVKVRFVNPTLQWYGGVITAVASKGDKVKIKYDDGTKESARFPDKEIIVDADGNGEHSLAVKEFVKAFRPKVIGIALGTVPLSIKRKKMKKKKKNKEKINENGFKQELIHKAKKQRRKDALPIDGNPVTVSDAMSSSHFKKKEVTIKEERKAETSEKKASKPIAKVVSNISPTGAVIDSTIIAIERNKCEEVVTSPVITISSQTPILNDKAIAFSADMENIEPKANNDSDIATKPASVKNTSNQEEQLALHVSIRSSTPDVKVRSLPSFRDDCATDILIGTTVSDAIITEPTGYNDSLADASVHKTESRIHLKINSRPVESTGVEVDNKLIEAEKPRKLENKGFNISSRTSDNGIQITHDKVSENEGKHSITKNEILSDDENAFKLSINRNRKAAHKAHRQISSNDGRVIEESRGKPRRKEKEDGRKGKKAASKEDVEDWVQCDVCAKWRLIPSVKDLPEKWYCQLNVTDPKRSICNATEQTPEEVARERKKAKKAAARKLGRRSVSPAVVPRRNSSQKVKGSSDHGLDKKRNSLSLEKSISEDSVDNFQLFSKKKAIAPQASVKDEDSDTEVVAPQPRKGRRGRRSNEEKGEVRGRRGKKEKEEKKQEWVQCEKCEKWRRLPRHIPAEDLPDKWYCSLNDWDPRSASCAVQEDYKIEDEKEKDNIILTRNGQGGGTGGSKLSFKNLIRRPNRNITERMRATESIFSSHAAEAAGEQSGTQAVVLYANSSMFLKRPNYHRTADQHDLLDNVKKVSLFDLMSRSQLWKDLYYGFGPIGITSYTQSFDSNSFEKHYQESSEALDKMKAMVFYAVGAKEMSASDILLDCQCREWVNKHWIELSASFTHELVCALVKQLIKDGLLELVIQTRDLSKSSLNETLYKRSSAIDDDASSRGQKKRKELEHRHSSRSMKFSKPWKRVRADDS